MQKIRCVGALAILIAACSAPPATVVIVEGAAPDGGSQLPSAELPASPGLDAAAIADDAGAEDSAAPDATLPPGSPDAGVADAAIAVDAAPPPTYCLSTKGVMEPVCGGTGYVTLNCGPDGGPFDGTGNRNSWWCGAPDAGPNPCTAAFTGCCVSTDISILADCNAVTTHACTTVADCVGFPPPYNYCNQGFCGF